jgi:hypothetical protein
MKTVPQAADGTMYRVGHYVLDEIDTRRHTPAPPFLIHLSLLGTATIRENPDYHTGYNECQAVYWYDEYSFEGGFTGQFD